MNNNNNTVTIREANRTRFGNKPTPSARRRMDTITRTINLHPNMLNDTEEIKRKLICFIDLARESRQGLADAKEYLRLEREEGVTLRLPTSIALTQDLDAYSDLFRSESEDESEEEEYDERKQNVSNRTLIEGIKASHRINEKFKGKEKMNILSGNKKSFIKKEIIEEEDDIRRPNREEFYNEMMERSNKRLREQVADTEFLLREALASLEQRQKEIDEMRENMEKTEKESEELKRKIHHITRELECPMCLELMTNTRHLACGHDVCDHCAWNIFNEEKKECPLCSKEITTKVVPAIPRNYKLEEIKRIIEPKEYASQVAYGSIQIHATNTQSDEEEDSIVITENVGGEPLDLNESDVDSEEEY